MSLEKVRQMYHFPPVYVHSAEASWLSSPVDNLSGLDRHADLEDIVCKDADFLYEIRSDYDIADFHFYVLETPGHSAGGVSIVFPEDHLVLSGDALFRETIGRTDLPTGNAAQLLAVLEKNSFPFHLPIPSIPVMALKLLLVTRRCSIPSLDNLKKSCILLPVLIKDTKSKYELAFYYILRKRLMEIDEPIAPIKIPNPNKPPTIIGTKRCGL